MIPAPVYVLGECAMCGSAAGAAHDPDCERRRFVDADPEYRRLRRQLEDATLARQRANSKRQYAIARSREEQTERAWRNREQQLSAQYAHTKRGAA